MIGKGWVERWTERWGEESAPALLRCEWNSGRAKKRQQNDIGNAYALWREYKEQKLKER